MSTLLDVLGTVVLCAGVVVEYRRLLAAPGFAVIAGALLALYLWFLARARRSVDISRRRDE
jgi:Flp pilus assembly protein TadB